MSQAPRAKWASLHWIRFAEVTPADALELATLPQGAASWKIGPDGPVGPDGYRLPGCVWCAVGLYRERATAEQAVEAPANFMPFLARAVESWHVALQPVMHRGECNHLDRAAPGELFRVEGEDPGGPLVAMTTAGFHLGPQLDVNRVIDFRRNVDRVRTQVAAAPGNLAVQVFTPHTYGDDGFTTSVWRDDAAMMGFAYKTGLHRTQLERYKSEQTADRTSFTRLRPLRSSGQWQGRDPLTR